MTCFSAESEKSFYFSDLLIIQEVEKYPILWDIRKKGYRNETTKVAIFQAIAAKLGKDVEDVMDRWHQLRRSYVRKKRAALEKGAGGIAVISWPLFKYLNFLGPSVRHRKIINKSPIILRCGPEEILPNSSGDGPVIFPLSHLPDSSDDDVQWCDENTSDPLLMSPQLVEIKSENEHVDTMEVLDNTETDNADRGTVNLDINTNKSERRANVLHRNTDRFNKSADNVQRSVDTLNQNMDQFDRNLDQLDKDNLDFFKSLLPMCRDLTNTQKLEFRSEVMNALRRIL